MDYAMYNSNNSNFAQGMQQQQFYTNFGEDEQSVNTSFGENEHSGNTYDGDTQQLGNSTFFDDAFPDAYDPLGVNVQAPMPHVNPAWLFIQQPAGITTPPAPTAAVFQNITPPAPSAPVFQNVAPPAQYSPIQHQTAPPAPTAVNTFVPPAQQAVNNGVNTYQTAPTAPAAVNTFTPPVQQAINNGANAYTVPHAAATFTPPAPQHQSSISIHQYQPPAQNHIIVSTPSRKIKQPKQTKKKTSKQAKDTEAPDSSHNIAAVNNPNVGLGITPGVYQPSNNPAHIAHANRMQHGNFQQFQAPPANMTFSSPPVMQIQNASLSTPQQQNVAFSAPPQDLQSLQLPPVPDHYFIDSSTQSDEDQALQNHPNREILLQVGKYVKAFIAAATPSQITTYYSSSNEVQLKMVHEAAEAAFARQLAATQPAQSTAVFPRSSPQVQPPSITNTIRGETPIDSTPKRKRADSVFETTPKRGKLLTPIDTSVGSAEDAGPYTPGLMSALAAENAREEEREQQEQVRVQWAAANAKRQEEAAVFEQQQANVAEVDENQSTDAAVEYPFEFGAADTENIPNGNNNPYEVNAGVTTFEHDASPIECEDELENDIQRMFNKSKAEHVANTAVAAAPEEETSTDTAADTTAAVEEAGDKDTDSLFGEDNKDDTNDDMASLFGEDTAAEEPQQARSHGLALPPAPARVQQNVPQQQAPAPSQQQMAPPQQQMSYASQVQQQYAPPQQVHQHNTPPQFQQQFSTHQQQQMMQTLQPSTTAADDDDDDDADLDEDAQDITDNFNAFVPQLPAAQTAPAQQYMQMPVQFAGAPTTTAAGPNAPLCQFYLNSNGATCPFGANCNARHFTVTAPNHALLAAQVNYMTTQTSMFQDTFQEGVQCTIFQRGARLHCKNCGQEKPVTNKNDGIRCTPCFKRWMAGEVQN